MCNLQQLGYKLQFSFSKTKHSCYQLTTDSRASQQKEIYNAAPSRLQSVIQVIRMTYSVS